MRQIRTICCLIAGILMLSLTLTLPADAQSGGAIAFKGLPAGAGQPVEITADSLSVSQADAQGTFSGNVLVVQGDLRLSADTLLVSYLDGDRKKIDKLTATGNVLLSTPTEAAKGAKAVYSLTTRQIDMTGDVLLTQGDSVMSGNSLTVDLASGTGQMNGRVKTILQPVTK
jgi:lipopolysaccharide export system protein LptA